MKTLTATILGLNSDSAQTVKNNIDAAISADFKFNWVSFSEKTIDVIFLNHHFLGSHAVQNYLQQHPDVQYLCLEYNHELAGKIAGHQLYYPFSHSTDLSAWIYLKFAQSSQRITTIPEHLPEYIEQMLLARNSFLRLYQDHQDFAIIDTRTERIFLNPNIPMRLFFSVDLLQTYAKSSQVNAVQGLFKIIDLKVWLWELLYPVASTFETYNLFPQHCYKLEQWPQFSHSNDRKYLLKIATLFAHGAEIEYVAQKTNCSIEHIKSFIYLTELLQMSKRIERQEARFLVKNIEQESNSMGIFQGLFSKLRKKLGM